MYYTSGDMFEKESNFCCLTFNKCVSKEKEGGIIYLPQTRSFLLQASREDYLDMQYCPFCASKLPLDLTDMLMRIVYDNLKLDGFEDTRLPTEFRSDAWWRNRGL